MNNELPDNAKFIYFGVVTLSQLTSVTGNNAGYMDTIHITHYGLCPYYQQACPMKSWEYYEYSHKPMFLSLILN